MTQTTPDAIQGYYRYPAIYNETIVFTAEGDLWRVSTSGGMARRLTTHHGTESHATIAPDGKMIAFAAQYEGSTEVYTMPLNGGRPVRRTFEDVGAHPVGWTGDGKIIYCTNRYATLPNMQLRLVDPATNEEQMIPLAQASDGSFDETGKTLFFTRFAFQGSYTKRYKGGTAQNIWKFTEGDAEAVPLTSDYPGTSRTPMWCNGRFYFVSDRDGTMNLWSLDEAGEDLQQHTSHKGWDIQSPSLHNGRIVYQLGADLYLFQIESGKTEQLTITLASDFDQTRQRWVKNPLHYLTSWQLSPTGDRIVLTARGRIFIAPVESGRFVELTKESGIHEPNGVGGLDGVRGLNGVRYRGARFLGKDQGVVALSDATGELEFYKLAADGMGEPVQITDDGKVFRYTAVSSPDGNWLTYTNKDQELWIVDVVEKKSTKIATSEIASFFHMRWSPDGQWLAYVELAENNYPQIKIYNKEDGGVTAVTSDRVDSYSPAWSPDGKWLYFLSDRHFQTLVPGPWGPRQPDPYFDKTSKIYMLALQRGLRSPFKSADELYSEPKEKHNNKKNGNGEDNGAETTPVNIDLDGIMTRLYELPLPSGNYAHLTVNKKALFWSESSSDIKRKQKLVGVAIKNSELKPQTLAYDIKGYNFSQNGEKLLVYQNHTFSVFDAKPSRPKPDDKKRVDLSRWTFSVDLKKEWRQLFVEAWRLERDYFYDRNLHGIDWQRLLDRHLPLVDRITDRDELNHLIAQLVGELSALHTFVRDGDKRTGQDRIRLASLGATWRRDEAAGGYRIEHIYEAEPDYPDRQGPLWQPDSRIQEGDIITAINGISTLAPQHPALLLQNQAGQQVRISSKSKDSVNDERREDEKSENSVDVVDTIIVPISLSQEANLRYGEWEYHNRLHVEKHGASQIGYVHLRAMSGENYSEWAQNYYAIFDRNGLIIDVRHNRGGNIDSWILGKLLRQAWFYWQPRVGKPSWNMQYAFRGHMAVLCNERTSSDGETLSDGFRRLGLGKVIGTRTWGGEIWGSRNNWLVDKGIATAAQIGVYSAEGEWLIEGHGFDPDMVVDNLPHATFNGADAQLDAAIAYLQTQIRDNPNPVPSPPPHPDKSFDYGL